MGSISRYLGECMVSRACEKGKVSIMLCRCDVLCGSYKAHFNLHVSTYIIIWFNLLDNVAFLLRIYLVQMHITISDWFLCNVILIVNIKRISYHLKAYYNFTFWSGSSVSLFKLRQCILCFLVGAYLYIAHFKFSQRILQFNIIYVAMSSVLMARIYTDRYWQYSEGGPWPRIKTYFYNSRFTK